MSTQLSRAMAIMSIIVLSINASSAANDIDVQNNQKSIVVNVVRTYDINLTFVKLDNGVYQHHNYSNNTLKDVAYMQKMYPVADTFPHTGVLANITDTVVPIPGIRPCDDRVAFRQVADKLVLSGFNASKDNPFTKVIGVMPAEFNGGCTVTTTSQYRNYAVITEDIYQSLPHEVAHTLNVCHDESRTRWTENNNWLAERGEFCINRNSGGSYIGTNCDGAHCYVPTSDLALIKGLFNEYYYGDQPGRGWATNLMSPNPGRNLASWIDNETYVPLLNALAVPRPIVFTGSPVFILRGDANSSSASLLSHQFTASGGQVVNDGDYAEGSVRLVAKSNGGSVLHNLSFNPGLIMTNFTGGSQEYDDGPFLFTIPYENVSTIELYFNDTLVQSLTVSPNSPQVSLNTLLDGVIFSSPFNVSWNASDLDNNSIVFAILLSSDGGASWSTLAMDLNDTSINVDNAYFQYGTYYRIKILASDGMNTGETISTGTFTIIPPPRVSADSAVEIYSQQSHKVIETLVRNNGGQELPALNWQFDIGQLNLSSSENSLLTKNEELTIIVEHNYSTGGPKNLTFFVFDNNKSVNDSLTTSIFVGDLRVRNLAAVRNGSQVEFSFVISDNGSTSLSEINWTLDTGELNKSASSLITLLAYENTTRSVSVNYSDSGFYPVRVTAWNSFNSYTDEIALSIPDFEIEDYGVIYQDYEQVILDGTITNQLSTSMAEVSWQIETGEDTLQAADNVTLSPGESLSIIVEKQYATYGNFAPKLTVTDGSHTNWSTVPVSVLELLVYNLQSLGTNGSQAVFAFDVADVHRDNKTLYWSFDTNDTGRIDAALPIDLVSDEQVSVLVQHNFTDPGQYTVMATASTPAANYSASTSVTI